MQVSDLIAEERKLLRQRIEAVEKKRTVKQETLSMAIPANMVAPAKKGLDSSRKFSTQGSWQRVHPDEPKKPKFYKGTVFDNKSQSLRAV